MQFLNKLTAAHLVKNLLCPRGSKWRNKISPMNLIQRQVNLVHTLTSYF